MKFLVALLMLCVISTSADARRRQPPTPAPLDFFAQFTSQAVETTTTTNSLSRRRSAGSPVTMLPHPNGCPRSAFCACGASIAVFGKNIRSLWPSSAWFQFKRTAPAPGMVAVRRGHVFVLREPQEGSTWIVEDYNSGGGRSRIHPRSIAGYTIVNPHA